jgi:hypothetical protein
MSVKSKENNSNRNYKPFQSRKCNAYGIFLFKGVCCKSLMNAPLRVAQYSIINTIYNRIIFSCPVFLL